MDEENNERPPSFIEDIKKLPNGKFDCKDLTDKEMAGLRNFNNRRPGVLQSDWSKDMMENIFGWDIPLHQYPHPYVSGKPRERQLQYADLSRVRCLFTRRRSQRNRTEDCPNLLLQIEASNNNRYSRNAVEQVIRTYKIEPDLDLGDAEGVSNEKFLNILLLSVELNRARLRYHLHQASRRMVLEVLNKHTAKLTPIQPLTPADLVHFAAVNGQKVTLDHPSMKPVTFFVCAVREDTVIINIMDESDFRAKPEPRDAFSQSGLTPSQQPPDNAQKVTGLPNHSTVWARFHSAHFTERLMVSSMIDAWTGPGDDYFGNRGPHYYGTPLVSPKLLAELRAGKYFGVQCNDAQRKGLCDFLEHKAALNFFSVFGPPGTGKTNLTVAICKLLHDNSLETDTKSGLILYCVPSNACGKAAVTRLAQAGIEKKRMLQVLAESTSGSCCNTVDVKCIRVTHFAEENVDEVQIVIATYQAAMRIQAGKDFIKGLYQRPPLGIIFEESFSKHFSEMLGTFAASGEPVFVLGSGDPLQLMPRALSQTATHFGGSTTVMEALRRKPGYFKQVHPYPIPEEHMGILLTENLRASTKLVKITSDVFYGGLMIPSQASYNHDQQSTHLMWMVNSVKLMRGLEGPFVFLDRTTKCKKDSATMSYYNTAEADLVANLAAEVAAKAGIQHLLITAPYKAQVDLLRLKMKQLDMPVSIGTVDETQGGECSIVIVSLTRSPLGTEHSMHPLGFLASKNRANVMFSRAKHLVFFVGSLQLFTDCDVPFWRDLVSRAEVRDVNAWLSKTPK